MKQDWSKWVSIITGMLLFALIFLGYGFVTSSEKLWPAHQADKMIEVVKSFLKYGEFVPSGRRIAVPEGAARERVVVHDPAAAMGEGYYAVFGWDDEIGSYAIWLYDAKGELRHLWPVNEKSFYARAKHNSNAPHAMEIMPDGSVIVSFDWLGMMTRLDACGEPMWLQEGFYHHAFSRDDDGGIWTWYGEKTGYGQIQDIVKFDPDTGEVVTRISFNDDVVRRSRNSAMLFSMRTDTKFVPDDRNPPDIFHPNDVEPLPAAYADAFPMFDPGDLLLSIRNLNLLMVIDQTGKVKWHQAGPWLMQHDPDFEADGTILVFNNARGRTRSDVYSVDPATGETKSLLYDVTVPFNSQFRGKQQRLPNGNILVTIPEQGQVFEFTPDAKVAVEFNNLSAAGPEYNEDIANAKWLPEDFFDTFPSCPAP